MPAITPTFEVQEATIPLRPNGRVRIIAAVVLQLLWALLLVALSFYLLVHAPESPGHTAKLRAAAALIGMPGLVAAAGGLGLFKQKLWGWWLSLSCDCSIAAVLVYSIIDDARDGFVDEASVVAAGIAMVPAIYLVIPGVRRSLRPGMNERLKKAA